MKKAADASPNRALKRERELRCWSQLELADRINTTAFNVGRWERGITFPGAYFRQQLCLIFEKSPQELGFLAGVSADKQAEQFPVQNRSAEMESLIEPTEEGKLADLEGDLAVPSAASPLPTTPVAEATRFIWNIPYRRNPFFSGREETLQALHLALNPGDMTTTQVVAVSGLGGMGKTQTTIEYVYRYRHEYQTVLWARADTHELLIADFASIAALFNLPEKNDQDQSHAVAAVKRWLSRGTGWLLVLDNADDLAMVSDFMPETVSGHLLLTTRAQSTGHIAQRIPMEKLSVEEGGAFLLRRAKLLATSAPLDKTYAHWPQARAIAEVMDGLPLALDQAAAYIEETGCGLHGYMQRYQKHGITLLGKRGGLRPDHPEPVATTWSLSFKRVAQANPTAAELLRLCAFLHPDAIAEEILIEGACGVTPYLHILSTDLLELDAAIGALTTFSLLRRDPEKHLLALHRLVQLVLREQMDEETQRLWAERAIQVVERAFPAVSFTTWQRCQQCLPHALVCADFIIQLHITRPSALSLLNKAGSYLRERTQYSEAERLLTLALTLSEETLAWDAPMVAESLNNLGMLAHDQGKYAQAEALLKRALTICEQVWGPEHIMVAQSLSNLAANYRVQGRQSEMEALVQQALSIRENALSPEHPDIAKSLDQLASLYQGQGKYSLAEPLYWRALKIRQQALGSEHIDVAENLNNLAYLYHALGKYAQAKSLYQQSLAFCEKNLGAQHMYTAASLGNLAEVYRAQGELIQAEQLHQRTLEIRKQTLGVDHPQTGKSLNWLAEIYLTQGKYSQSEAMALQALEIWEKNLGLEHYYTANGLDTLARLRRAQGHIAQAEPLALRALAIYRKIWESDNQYIANSLNTLAEISYDQERYTQVEALLQQALLTQEQALGAEHPDTARSLYNLAMLYTQQGEYSRAEGYFAHALSILQKALLPQHHDLIILLQQYRNLLRKTGNTAQILLLDRSIGVANDLVEESLI